MSYATLAELKVWITSNGDVDTADDAGLQLALDASTRQIDAYCGRTFTSEVGATKLYYPSSATVLEVVDLVSVTSLASDSHGDRTFVTTFTPDQYELLPYQDAAGAPAVRYQVVHIWGNSSRSFTPGYLVQVVGDFGYLENGAAPAEVRQANLIQAARLWKRRETPLGILSNTDLGTFERLSKSDPDVAALLAGYSRTQDWVLV